MKILNIDFEKYKLKNGLEVILHKNDHIPLTAVNLWYKVGSSFEKPGKSGLAHLFEHMMFQGSLNVPKDMHFKYIQEAGGTLNGSTNFDRTNYYEKVPSNFLEMVLWLESDRMGYFLPSLTQEKLTNQIEVVKNERLERYDNQPYGLAWEIILNNIYPKNHPYSWPTIGSIEDISSYTLDDVKEFFQEFYSPQNASLTIAGNIDINKTKDLVEKYFAEIENHADVNPKELKPLPDLEYFEMERRENVQLDRLYLVFRTNKIFTEDDAAIDILADILTGSKNSRFYKELVFDKELAQDISIYPFSGKLSGHFIIIATAKPGVELDTLKKYIFDMLEKLAQTGFTEKELLKSKNSLKSSFIYSLQNVDSIADQLNYYNFFAGDPNYFVKDLERYENLNNDMLKNCINKYFNENYFELQILQNNLGEI